MNTNTALSIRTNTKIRDRAKRVFAKIGMTTSAAVNMFLVRVVSEQGLPFKPVIDTKKLAAEWKREVDDAIKNGKRYKNAAELFADLDK